MSSTSSDQAPATSSPGGASAAHAFLREAKAELRNGSLARSWQACQQAAAIGRAINDAAIVADAATLITGTGVGGAMFAAERHLLCLEALSLLGTTDRARRLRVEAQIRVTRNPWVPDDGVQPRPPVSVRDAEQRAGELHARYAALIGVGREKERLCCADEMAALGVSPATEEHLAWATLWRLDTLCQLGARMELNAELINLTVLSHRLRSPAWSWRTAAAHASVALLDGYFEDAPELIEAARRLGVAGGIEEASFLNLVLRSNLAVRTGEGLGAVEAEVRHAVLTLPVFAQGWHARILLARGRTEEAVEIWRALAPRLGDLPQTSHEWLVAQAVHAELCAAAEDKDAARYLLAVLKPFSRLQVMAGVLAPYEGPVAYYLGLLSVVTGEFPAARAYFTESIRRSELLHAPAFTQLARTALSSLLTADPLLTLREHEVASLVAEGLTNREIAVRLALSGRTVENHVGNILHKIGISSRSGIGVWLSKGQ